MKPSSETAIKMGKEIISAGGPDGTADLVHVDAYTQDRNGTATNVSQHFRSPPNHGLVAADRPAPKVLNPIRGGTLRGHGAGDFHASRQNKDGSYRQHQVVDILAEPGTPVVSAATGTVTKVWQSSGRDSTLQYVEITTADGYVIRHHYVSPQVTVGDKVSAGVTPIGSVQNIIPAYGKDVPNHVHLEVRDSKIPANNDKQGYKGYKTIDPEPFLW